MKMETGDGWATEVNHWFKETGPFKLTIGTWSTPGRYDWQIKSATSTLEINGQSPSLAEAQFIVERIVEKVLT